MTANWSFSLDRPAGRPGLVTVGPMTDMSESTTWLAGHRAELRQALLDYGCLMLRGLAIASPADFAAARDILMDKRVPYREKATPRSDYGDGVFSSTDLPASQPIELHNENSYTLEFPGVLVFGCLQAPASGGATTVADVRRVLAELPPATVARFRAHGWLLVRNYADHVGLPWPTAFGTDHPHEVAEYCAANKVGLRWTDDGHLRTGQVRPAIIRHPRTGDEVWFNHVAFWNMWALDAEVREVMLDSYGPDGLPFATYDGSGAPLTEADLAAVRAAYERATVREPWQQGDLLIVDNVLCAHGREAFTGPRRIVVAMGEPVALADCQPTVAPRSFDVADLPARPPDVSPPTKEADPVERALAAIWGEVLGIQHVRADDSFPALGGQSLLAMQVVHRIREHLGVDLPMRALYDTPVLRDLAATVAAAASRRRAEPASGALR